MRIFQNVVFWNYYPARQLLKFNFIYEEGSLHWELKLAELIPNCCGWMFWLGFHKKYKIWSYTINLNQNSVLQLRVCSITFVHKRWILLGKNIKLCKMAQIQMKLGYFIYMNPFMPTKGTLASSVDPNKMLQNAASYQGLCNLHLPLSCWMI